MNTQLETSIIQTYLQILHEELVPARGCTEPISISFATAKAREVLGSFPDKCSLECSGNIIKNVKSVTIPGTNNLIGIEAAMLAGLIAGKSELNLEVISQITNEQALEIKSLMGSGLCKIKPLKSEAPLHIIVHAQNKTDTVLVEIKHSHTNIVSIEKNGQVLFANHENNNKYLGTFTDRSVLNVDNIYEFANTVDLNLVSEILEKQISLNYAIAEEGMLGNFGVGFGKILLENCPGNCIPTKIKAYTAAASEARMSGCNLPVITNSGSGNQGIASSIPSIIYAKEKNCTHTQLLRALILANLLTIHQKTLIGRLSAFCGVVSAACASGAAITYLSNASLKQIKMTISNTLAISAGIICDGAKASCGAKIAASLDAAYTSHLLAMAGRAYKAGDGIVKNDIEKTISSVGRVARDGMKETEDCILRIMLEC